jgi:hypothetical protein
LLDISARTKMLAQTFAELTKPAEVNDAFYTG